MKASSASIALAVPFALILAFVSSCTTVRPLKPIAEAPDLPLEKPLPEEPPSRLMGMGSVGAGELAAFLSLQNPDAERSFVRELAELYVQEAAVEGISHDIAFAQMCLETGYLKFGGLVTSDMHNYCGLGSIGAGKPGERFPAPRIGIRAHVQHLKGYATSEPLKGELVDPRYRWIKYGSAATIADLSGRWASDKEYGTKIAGILARLYDFVRSRRSA